MGCYSSKGKDDRVAEPEIELDEVVADPITHHEAFGDMQEFKQLSDLVTMIDFTKIPKFTLNGLRKYAIVKSCYDGDSAHIAILMPDVSTQGVMLQEFMCRFMWYDSPEIRGVSDKTPGLVARDYLKSLIEHKIVFVKFYKFDKYNRPLVEVYNIDIEGGIEKISVNQKMINHFPDMPKMKYWGH